MTSEDGEAHILYISGSVYHHIDDLPANANRQNMVGSDLRRYRSYVPASLYADTRFLEEHPNAGNARVITVEEPCEKSRESLDKLKEINRSRIAGNYDNEYAGKIYSYDENGKKQVCLVRLALEKVEMPTMSGMMGNMQPGSSKDTTWTVLNEMHYWGSEEGVNKYWPEFEKVYESIAPGPDYIRFTNEINRIFMQTSQTISNNAMQMANAQMESSRRMGNMINDTYAYGMELDRQSWMSTSATMDKVADMRSEAIRGVNSYSTGNGDYIEADVKYDSVYQNNSDTDIYAGVEGMYDMGSEWTILKKKY